MTLLQEKLSSLLCVKAGWAFGVPEDGRAQWLELVEAAIREEFRAELNRGHARAWQDLRAWIAEESKHSYVHSGDAMCAGVEEKIAELEEEYRL